MKVNYVEEPALKVGIPYTWGSNNHWYMNTTGGNTICLNDGASITSSKFSDIQNYAGLRYAKSMEIL